MAASLLCIRCNKKYSVRDYNPDKRYTCPGCKVTLVDPASEAPTVPGGIGFKDEPPPPPKEIPVRLGKYLIDGEIARGGMGVVYKGRQEGLERVVAIKMLLGGFASDPQAVQRFHRESRAAAKLRHPNLVAIHEVGDFNGQPFFTMDYIEGKSLDGLLREAPIPPRRGAEILLDAARGVHHAHEEGVIHRDIKPGNILLDREGKALVTDFGLAKDLDSKSMLSMTGDVFGTPAFMSPEQAEGRVREVDRQTDVYALGAVLYRILTGRAPFEGPTLAATIYKVVHEYTTEPARLDPRIPVDLSAVCMKALEKDKKARYATAEDFARDLERWLAGEAVTARPLGTAQRLGREARRQKKVLLAAGSVAALALVAIVILVFALGKNELDLIEENLSRPELRKTALESLVSGLDRFKDRKRAVALAQAAVASGKDEASREAAYARPSPALADAYLSHLPIEAPERLRVRLIQVLAQLKHRQAVPGMLDIVARARGPVRIAALKFFQAVPDARAYHAIGSLVTDRECGSEAQIAMRRQYVDNVVSFFNPSAARAGGALAELGSALDQYNRQMEEALGEKRGSKDPTQAALRSRSRDERMKAAYELGLSKDPKAREALVGALEDEDDGVARMAASSLAALGAAPHKEKLLAQLGSPRPGLRRNAAWLLGQLGDTSARPAIEAAYKSESDAEAKYAMEDALVALR